MLGPNSKTDLEIYTNASVIWQAMYADCAAAEQSIEFEQYILKDDDAGHKFLKLFTEKVKQGVSVQLMLDRIGSRDLLVSPAFSELINAGGIAYFYNPIDLGTVLTPAKWLPRNHIKTLLIDGKIGYTGSACIWEDTAHWHDLQVRLTGPPVEDIRNEFSRLWAEAGKKQKPPPLHNGRARSNVFYLTSQFSIAPNRIYRELLQGIHHARKNIRIVTPYFLPPWLLRRALYKAVRRGVNVQVMVSEKSDVPIADYVSRSYYPKLFRYGVHIFHYHLTVLHAKYAIVDDNWVTIGSTNMDYLSLLQNREANIFAADAAVAAKVREDFDSCMTDCRAVDMACYRAMPWWQRALGYLGRGMRSIL